ncbi:hypothetical protein EDD21DRAFT_364153 [Dissophora ornata]|nr:hypothetical protein EDD21DRAFT_364153 [Dissophora ornata]
MIHPLNCLKISLQFSYAKVPVMHTMGRFSIKATIDSRLQHPHLHIKTTSHNQLLHIMPIPSSTLSPTFPDDSIIWFLKDVAGDDDLHPTRYIPILNRILCGMRSRQIIEDEDLPGSYLFFREISDAILVRFREQLQLSFSPEFLVPFDMDVDDEAAFRQDEYNVTSKYDGSLVAIVAFTQNPNLNSVVYEIAARLLWESENQEHQHLPYFALWGFMANKTDWIILKCDRANPTQRSTCNRKTGTSGDGRQERKRQKTGRDRNKSWSNDGDLITRTTAIYIYTSWVWC